jgi:two-component system phosphate regulon response regulator PhoB
MPEGRAGATRPLILLVEDDAALSEMLSYSLEKEGFRVALAMNGSAGLSSVAENMPDLVLLDWMLPGLSGLEMCRQ